MRPSQLAQRRATLTAGGSTAPIPQDFDLMRVDLVQQVSSLHSDLVDANVDLGLRVNVLEKRLAEKSK
jgi:hypothetical protein